MNEEAFGLVKNSLAQRSQTVARKGTKNLEPREELLTYRITPETELPPLAFLFKMNGVECFPLSELVANTGKAKSGKTLFLSIVMACCLKKNVLGLEGCFAAKICEISKICVTLKSEGLFSIKVLRNQKIMFIFVPDSETGNLRQK